MPKSSRIPSPAVECSPAPDTTNTDGLGCPSCGDIMRHERTISRFGMLPETLVFVCPSCKSIVAARRMN
jgi:hypothetical protein